jgi:hypothetical protein
LLSKERIRLEFENKVVGDVPERIESKVTELIDWLVDSDLRQWQAVNEHLAERRRTHQERIVGEAAGSFSYDRDRLIDAVGREAQRIVETYDRAAEALAIARGAQEAVAASAVLEVGAIGLGALVATLATTAAADATGILFASVIFFLGLFIIPARRRVAKAELREKIAAMREQLAHSLRDQFEKEIQRSLHNINQAIAPYTRFVRAERGKLLESQTDLETITNSLNGLKVAIEES